MSQFTPQEILEEFTEYDGGVQRVEDAPTWLDGAIYMPPWHERFSDGELGPPYGPEKPSTYRRLLEEWEQSRAGGGLWDEETEIGCHPEGALAKRRADHRVARYDAEPMAEFMARYSAKMGGRKNRMVELYTCYYADGMSLGRTASRLGITANNAKQILKNLRSRLRQWMARTGRKAPDRVLSK